MSKPSDRFAGNRFEYGKRANGDGLQERKSPLDWAKLWFAQMARLSFMRLQSQRDGNFRNSRW